MSEKREFKGIWIPKHIWLNPALSPIEKLFLAEIDSLDNDDEKGCFASNEYFGNFFGISEGSAANIISSLRKRGYVVQTFFDGRNRGISLHENVKAGFMPDGSSLHENMKAGFTKRGKQVSRKGEHTNIVYNKEHNKEENNAGASAPLSPPFKKVDEIEPLEAEKEKDFKTGAGGGPTIVKLYDNELRGVTLVDSIPPQPITKPETTGRQRQTRNTPHIHPENETCFSYFSDPAKARAAWQEWIDYKYEQHRERYKAAKSELSKLRQLFKQFSGDSEKFEVAVNYSIGNLYKGVFPPKQEKENGQFQHLDKAQQQHLKLARFVADLRSGSAFAGAGKVDYITGEKPV